MSDNVSTYIGLNYDDTNTDYPVSLNKSLKIIDQNLRVGRNLHLDGNLYKIYNDTTYNVLDMDSAGNLAFSYGPWSSGLGTTKYLGNNIQISSKGGISINTSDVSKNITIGDSNTTNIYVGGRSMIRKGQTYWFEWNGAGYVTAGSKDVYFVIPTIMLAYNGAIATLNANNSSLCIRQWEDYLFGAASGRYTIGTNFTSELAVTNCGINVKLSKTTALSGKNNAPVCISCGLSITFT